MELLYNIIAIESGVILGLLAVVSYSMRTTRELKKNIKVEHLTTRAYVKDILSAVNIDSKNSVVVKTFIFEKYGIHLEDTDVLTLMILWNKEITTLEEFDKFVKKYLEDKKWLYH